MAAAVTSALELKCGWFEAQVQGLQQFCHQQTAAIEQRLSSDVRVVQSVALPAVSGIEHPCTCLLLSQVFPYHCTLHTSLSFLCFL